MSYVECLHSTLDFGLGLGLGLGFGLRFGHVVAVALPVPSILNTGFEFDSAYMRLKSLLTARSVFNRITLPLKVPSGEGVEWGGAGASVTVRVAPWASGCSPVSVEFAHLKAPAVACSSMTSLLVSVSTWEVSLPQLTPTKLL